MNITRLLAPNPGPMTGPGTNTWLVTSGDDGVVVDPGPVIEDHLEAIRAACRPFEVGAILLTHGHPDHAPAAAPLAAEWGVPIEAADAEREIQFGALRIEVIPTPGHTADSVSFLAEGALFAGDHLKTDSTVMVEDMAAYMDSLRRLLDRDLDVVYPGHGEPHHDPASLIAEYLSHRMMREAQILDAVVGATSIGDIVTTVYPDLPEELVAAAAVSVRAHVTKLEGEGLVRWLDGPEPLVVSTT